MAEDFTHQKTPQKFGSRSRFQSEASPFSANKSSSSNPKSRQQTQESNGGLHQFPDFDESVSKNESGLSPNLQVPPKPKRKMSQKSNLFGDVFEENEPKKGESSNKQETIDNIDFFNSVESSQINEKSASKSGVSLNQNKTPIKSKSAFDEFGYGEKPKSRSSGKKGGKVSFVFGGRSRATTIKSTSAEKGAEARDQQRDSKSVQVLAPSVYHKSAQKSDISFRVEEEEVQRLKQRIEELEAQVVQERERNQDQGEWKKRAELAEANLQQEQKKKEELQHVLKNVQAEMEMKKEEQILLRRSTHSKLKLAKAQADVLKGEILQLKAVMVRSKKMQESIQKIREFKKNNQSRIEELELEIDKKNQRIRTSAKSIKEFKVQLQKLREENIELVQRKEGIQMIEESKGGVRGELEWILGELVKLKTEKQKLESGIAVDHMKIRRRLEGLKKEVENGKKERKEERLRLEGDNSDLRAKNRELIQAIEDFGGDPTQAHFETKSKMGRDENSRLVSLENTTRKEFPAVKDEKITDLEAQIEEFKIDLEVHRDENKKLLEELLETQGQLASIETEYDIKHIDQKLESYEQENNELNQKNMDLMDEVFKLREELQKYQSRGKHTGWFQDNKIRDLEKENQRLKNELKSRDLRNDFEPVKFNKKTTEEREEAVQNIASLQKNMAVTQGNSIKETGFFKANVGSNERQSTAKGTRRAHPEDPKSSLSGRAFLNRFDILMRLNEETKKNPDVSFPGLLDSKYLTNELFQKKPTLARAFFRGMVDDSLVLLEEASLRMSCQSFYRVNPSDFQLFLEIQVLNQRSERLFLMAPRFFGGDPITLANPEEIDGNLEVAPGEQLNLSLCLKVSQMDLPLTLPPLLVFFSFSKNEFDQLLRNNSKDFLLQKRTLPLPVNILKFMTFPDSPDFSLVETLNLTEEMMISNNRIQLSDLKKVFPNLVILGFKQWSNLVRTADLSETLTIEDFAKQASNFSGLTFFCFGSKVQTYLGNIFIILELNQKESTILIKLFSFNDSDLCTSLMFYTRAILQNL